MIESEEEAEQALRLSSALTQKLLAYRFKTVSNVSKLDTVKDKAILTCIVNMTVVLSAVKSNNVVTQHATSQWTPAPCTVTRQ